MDTSMQRLLKMKKFIFWINALTSTEKESNQDWNTPSIWKTMVHILKSLWSFCLLSWLSTYVFTTSCGLNSYVYILQIVLDIFDKFIHDSQNVCRYFTLNEMHIKLASLIICLINDNLTNTSSTPPPEVKNKKLYCI